MEKWPNRPVIFLDEDLVGYQKISLRTPCKQHQWHGHCPLQRNKDVTGIGAAATVQVTTVPRVKDGAGVSAVAAVHMATVPRV